MSTVTWMWFGNQPQINTTSSTSMTTADAEKMIGYEATGSSQIEAVTLSGTATKEQTEEGRMDAFRTTYNVGNGTPTALTYTSPATGTTVTSVITGFARVTYEITIPGGSVVTQTGVLIQMRNGDIFFRPSTTTLPQWDGITQLSAIKITAVQPLPANNYVAAISFSPKIRDVKITCFTSGTLIRAEDGDRPVEELRPGDLVWTRDNGLQPLRWCGASHVDADMLAAEPRLRPIRIAANALGAQMPSAPLRVSPQHRILLRSAIAERMFGAQELLVPAKQLAGLPGITQDDGPDGVTYHHLLFDRHEIVLSNGAETESLYLGAEALRALPSEALAEIRMLFPDLLSQDHAVAPVRHMVRGARLRRLTERHIAKQRPLVSRPDHASAG